MTVAVFLFGYSLYGVPRLRVCSFACRHRNLPTVSSSLDALKLIYLNPNSSINFSRPAPILQSSPIRTSCFTSCELRHVALMVYNITLAVLLRIKVHLQ